MTLTRITNTLGALIVGGALGGVLVSSTYAAPSARPPAPVSPTTRGTANAVHFVAPVPHPYGANGMRMGLHCETVDLS